MVWPFSTIKFEYRAHYRNSLERGFWELLVTNYLDYYWSFRILTETRSLLRVPPKTKTHYGTRIFFKISASLDVQGEGIVFLVLAKHQCRLQFREKKGYFSNKWGHLYRTVPYRTVLDRSVPWVTCSDEGVPNVFRGFSPKLRHGVK